MDSTLVNKFDELTTRNKISDRNGEEENRKRNETFSALFPNCCSTVFVKHCTESVMRDSASISLIDQPNRLLASATHHTSKYNKTHQNHRFVESVKLNSEPQ